MLRARLDGKSQRLPRCHKKDSQNDPSLFKRPCRTVVLLISCCTFEGLHRRKVFRGSLVDAQVADNAHYHVDIKVEEWSF